MKLGFGFSASAPEATTESSREVEQLVARGDARKWGLLALAPLARRLPYKPHRGLSGAADIPLTVALTETRLQA